MKGYKSDLSKPKQQEHSRPVHVIDYGQQNEKMNQSAQDTFTIKYFKYKIPNEYSREEHVKFMDKNTRQRMKTAGHYKEVEKLSMKGKSYWDCPPAGWKGTRLQWV